jgi:aspartyl-tRNA(Asn)/glutamyl-tRNA(Gln) amidotransferase subunit B
VAYPDVVARIRDGKVQAAGVLVGAIMKATRGKADAARVRDLICSASAEPRHRAPAGFLIPNGLVVAP